MIIEKVKTNFSVSVKSADFVIISVLMSVFQICMCDFGFMNEFQLYLFLLSAENIDLKKKKRKKKKTPGVIIILCMCSKIVARAFCSDVIVLTGLEGCVHYLMSILMICN